MKKTQFGWPFFVIIPMIDLLVLLAEQNPLISILVIGISFIIMLLAYKMTIKVDDTSISFSMGIGLISKSYKLKNITSYKAITYTALGWGIRFKPGATLYNVSGNKAIELSLKGKKRRIWLGTNASEELVAFLQSKLSHTSS